MLKKLRKTNVAGIFTWAIELRLPTRRVHTHVDLSEQDARQVYASLLSERAHAKLALPFTAPKARMTLTDACSKYQHELLMTGKNADHISGVTFSLSLLRAAVGDSHPVELLTRAHIRLWREKRLTYVPPRRKKPSRASPRTINKGMAHLSAFFVWCCHEDLLEINPIASVPRVNEIKPLPKIMPWKAFCAFAETTWTRRPELGLFVEVLGETGARIGELFRAKVSDVDINRKTWTKIVKPGKFHIADAGPWVLAAATDRPAAAPLCPNPEGKPFQYHVIRDAFAQLCKLASVPRFTPHAIHHGRACWELLDGKTVHQVKEHLGHSTVTITEWYLRAVELLRREEPAGTIHNRSPILCHLCDKKFSKLPSVAPFTTISKTRQRKLNTSSTKSLT